MAAEGSQPLGPTQAARFRQALGQLQSGQADGALSIARALAQEAPRAADAWQLMGMCLAETAHRQEADEAFERALALSPGNPVVSRNYGVSLARHGKHLRGQGDWEAAEPVLRRALALSAGQPSAWVDLGVVLRELGRIDEALVALRRAADLLRQRGASEPGVEDAINGVLADAGRTEEALAGARRLVSLHPGHAPAHETLASLLWDNGDDDSSPGEDPFAAFRAAARAQPDNAGLQLAFARRLLAARRAEEALDLVQRLRQRDPGNPMLQWFAASALDALGRIDQAAGLYSDVARGELGDQPEFLNAYARHSFRSRRFELAATCASKVVAVDPHNQEGWSHLGTAWRLAGDGREHWLHDYERLVGYVEIEPPPGYGDLQTFLQELRATLDALHTARREPLSQSVRGGTQTAGQLFGRSDPLIKAAQEALRVAVERWVATLPDDAAHPFLSRRRRSVRFVGSWSVRLAAEGRHSSHIHPKGWASSAFYVSLPDSVLAADQASRSGWLQFGQPLEELGLDLPPRRVIPPRPGHLALFPSYTWHGTVPFDGRQSRLTIAFDMQPRP